MSIAVVHHDDRPYNLKALVGGGRPSSGPGSGPGSGDGRRNGPKAGYVATGRLGMPG